MANWGFFLKKKRALQVFFLETCNLKYVKYGEKNEAIFKNSTGVYAGNDDLLHFSSQRNRHKWHR